MADYRPIDADGHIIETDEELSPYLPTPYAGSRSLTALFPTLDGWQRGARKPEPIKGIKRWQTFFAASGVSGSVLYPTVGLSIGLVKDPNWAIVLARGYNNYLYGEYLQNDPERLWGIALLPIQDVGAAAEELERAVTELGMVGGLLPAVGLSRGIGHPMYDPLYRTAVRLNVPLAVHGGSSQGLGLDLYDSFVKVLVMEHAIAQQVQFTSYLLDGGAVRFPMLKIVFLEAGAGWVPYLMDRIDEKYEMHRHQAPLLVQEPSRYVIDSPIYFSCELEERTLPYLIERGLGDRLMYASDYPHERAGLEQFLGDVPRFQKRQDLTEDGKRRILHDNCVAFYALADR